MNIRSKLGQDLSQDRSQTGTQVEKQAGTQVENKTGNQDSVSKNRNCLKAFLRYSIIFACGAVGAFLAVIVFSEVVRTQVYSIIMFKGDIASEFALWDDESGEVLEFVITGANKAPDDSVEESDRIPQDVCVTDSNGRIRFLGRLDSQRGILSGDILLGQSDLESVAIVNKKSDRYHFLSENTTTIQTGDYYIVLNVSNIPSEKEEVRVAITIFYCPIYDLK